ncbi:MAG TPA: hypothetical protein VFA41_20165 [Ktedonobacteraceae bacterium]|jgi:hypothetical protein|nr:hypothetical protein [Ktedonobacteraceae bacterium]
MQENLYATNNTDYTRLLSLGFSEAEATRLVHMRDHVTEQVEYREMVEEIHRLNFLRWLVENKRIRE